MEMMADTPRLCAICQKRRPKRYCPGVGGDICTVCCGTEREVTVNCPLDCVYLQDAHRHENLPPIDPKSLPNSDIQLDQSFLERNQPLVILLSASIARSALETERVVDSDVRKALDG